MDASNGPSHPGGNNRARRGCAEGSEVAQSGCGKGPPESMASSVRTLVAELDPNLPAYNLSALDWAISEATWAFDLFGALFATSTAGTNPGLGPALHIQPPLKGKLKSHRVSALLGARKLTAVVLPLTLSRSGKGPSFFLSVSRCRNCKLKWVGEVYARVKSFAVLD